MPFFWYTRSMKKIYFAGSIRGGRDDHQLYGVIIDMLKKYGTVLTEHVGDKKLTPMGEDSEAKYLYNRDVTWVCEADIIVAEVTQPSLGVGYEIGYAEAQGKKIICLYRPQEGRRLSAMLLGNTHVTVHEYNDVSELESFFGQLFG